MPDIEWNIDSEFRREFSNTLRAWDFRIAPQLTIVVLPPPKAVEQGPVPTDLKAATEVVLTVDMVVRREAGRLPHRVFIVRPKGPADEKAIADWRAARGERRKWMMEGML
jgi:hypothetical protein